MKIDDIFYDVKTDRFLKMSPAINRTHLCTGCVFAETGTTNLLGEVRTVGFRIDGPDGCDGRFCNAIGTNDDDDRTLKGILTEATYSEVHVYLAALCESKLLMKSSNFATGSYFVNEIKASLDKREAAISAKEIKSISTRKLQMQDITQAKKEGAL